MNKKLKIVYRRNLKMSPGKIAAQCCHAAIGLGVTDPMISVVILKASDKKYYELMDYLFDNDIVYYNVFDAGFTEIESNTETCVAYLK